MYVCSTTAFNRFFTRRLGLANALASAGGGIGMAIMPYLVHYLKSQFGTRGMFLIMAGILLNGTVAAFLLAVNPVDTSDLTVSHQDVKESCHINNSTNQECIEKSEKLSNSNNLSNNETSPLLNGQKGQSKYTNDSNNFHAFRNHCSHCSIGFVTFLFFAFCMIYTALCVINVLPSFVIEAGYPQSLGPTLLSVTGIPDTIVRPLLSLLQDRPGFNKEWMLCSVNFILGVVTLLLVLLPYEVIFYVFTVCFGAFGMLQFVYVGPILMDFVGKQKLGGAMGLFQLLTGVSGVINPLITGKYL